MFPGSATCRLHTRQCRRVTREGNASTNQGIPLVCHTPFRSVFVCWRLFSLLVTEKVLQSINMDKHCTTFLTNMIKQTTLSKILANWMGVQKRHGRGPFSFSPKHLEHKVPHPGEEKVSLNSQQKHQFIRHNDDNCPLYEILSKVIKVNYIW